MRCLTSLELLLTPMDPWILGKHSGSLSRIGLVWTLGSMVAFQFLWPSGLLHLLVCNKPLVVLQHLPEEHMDKRQQALEHQQALDHLQESRAGPWLPWAGPEVRQDLAKVVALEVMVVQVLQVRIQILMGMCPPSTSSRLWGG